MIVDVILAFFGRGEFLIRSEFGVARVGARADDGDFVTEFEGYGQRRGHGFNGAGEGIP